MAYVHPSARAQGSPTDYWCLKGATANNPFLEYDLASRTKAAAIAASCEKDEESKWLEDVKFGLAHINPIGEIIVKPHKYRLVMDMLHFKPEEISIRAVKKGFFVRAAHPEKMEDGREYITHHFYREYVLPHDIDPTRAYSWMTPENILFIEAPKVEFDPSEIDEDDEGHNVKEVKMGRSSSSDDDHFDERRHLQQPQSEAIKTETKPDLPDYGFPISVLIFVFILVATVIGTLICILLYYHCFAVESPSHLKNRYKRKKTVMFSNQSSRATNFTTAFHSSSTAY